VKVVTAVANAISSRNLTVKSKGEVAGAGRNINNMTGTLETFADQVTTVARECGVEVASAGSQRSRRAGNWKDLDRHFNLLAANLTTQGAAIAEVATAVTKGY